MKMGTLLLTLFGTALGLSILALGCLFAPRHFLIDFGLIAFIIVSLVMIGRSFK